MGIMRFDFGEEFYVVVDPQGQICDYSPINRPCPHAGPFFKSAADAKRSAGDYHSGAWKPLREAGYTVQRCLVGRPEQFQKEAE